MMKRLFDAADTDCGCRFPYQTARFMTSCIFPARLDADRLPGERMSVVPRDIETAAMECRMRIGSSDTQIENIPSPHALSIICLILSMAGGCTSIYHLFADPIVMRGSGNKPHPARYSYAFINRDGKSFVFMQGCDGLQHESVPKETAIRKHHWILKLYQDENVLVTIIGSRFSPSRNNVPDDMARCGNCPAGDYGSNVQARSGGSDFAVCRIAVP